jgi:hypothetical protein
MRFTEWRNLSQKHKQDKIFTLEKLMANQIYNQKTRARRSSATVAGNELSESKLKSPNLLVNEEETNQWLRLKTVTPATLLM